MMEVWIRLLWMVGLLVTGSRAESGVSARLVPATVRPGEVFELRVEMARPDYGHFELKVPPQPGLHRVAVEARPVGIRDGIYRQAESWFLQADHSGEIRIEGLTVMVETTSGASEQALPAMVLEVLPYAGSDGSEAPLEFPQAVSAVGSRGWSFWWWVPVVVVVGVVVWKVRRGPLPEVVDEEVAESRVMAELKMGRLPTAELGGLLEESGSRWSEALRSRVEQAVYAGRGDPEQLAKQLGEEGVR